MLVEAGGMVRGAGLLRVGVEEVRWGWCMVCLSHHVGFRDGKLLLTVVAEKWRVELWLARCRREDGEVAVTEARREETRLLLLLRLRRKTAGAGWTERGRLGLDLAGEVLG